LLFTQTVNTSVIGLARKSDFNGDGKSDILWRGTSTGQVKESLMDGFTSIGGAYILAPATPAWDVAGTGDLNGDGKADIVWCNSTTGQVTGWLMNGTTMNSAATLLGAGNSAWDVAGVGDLNGDGRQTFFGATPRPAWSRRG